MPKFLDPPHGMGQMENCFKLEQRKGQTAYFCRGGDIPTWGQIFFLFFKKQLTSYNKYYIILSKE